MPDDAAHWTAVEEATELLHEERYREALVELRAVLKKDPSNPYAYYFLGVAFFEVGEIEAARDAYAACLKLAPSHLGARVALSHVLRILGDVRGAIREGLDALSRTPAIPTRSTPWASRTTPAATTRRPASTSRHSSPPAPSSRWRSRRARCSERCPAAPPRRPRTTTSLVAPPPAGGQGGERPSIHHFFGPPRPRRTPA